MRGITLLTVYFLTSTVTWAKPHNYGTTPNKIPFEDLQTTEDIVDKFLYHFNTNPWVLKTLHPYMNLNESVEFGNVLKLWQIQIGGLIPLRRLGPANVTTYLHRDGETESIMKVNLGPWQNVSLSSNFRSQWLVSNGFIAGHLEHIDVIATLKVFSYEPFNATVQDFKVGSVAKFQVDDFRGFTRFFDWASKFVMNYITSTYRSLAVTILETELNI